jgi:hypothetical protein
MTDSMTTYDFCSKTFGHATMLVGGYGGDAMPEVMEELRLAREKLEREFVKCRKGEPYDWRFCGHQKPDKDVKHGRP